MNFARIILNGIADFVLPPVCIGCGKSIDNHKDFVCSECINELDDTGDTVYSAPDIDYFFSLYKFYEKKPIHKIIHSLKYEQMKSVGFKFGKFLGEKIKEKMKTEFNIIIPVPLHKAKERERKYNQSTFICRGVNSVLNIGLPEKYLKRIRYTESQTKLGIDERKQNVKGAFVANARFLGDIGGKNIILIDDVVTTGSTILECASVLKSAGCGKILACSLAKA